MPKGIPNRAAPEPIIDEGNDLPPDYEAETVAEKPRMVPVTLNRHYRPATENYEVVGHWVPKVELKDVAGRMVTISPERFEKGAMAPPPIASVGTLSVKLWAGTVVKLPVDEARTVRRAEIGSYEIVD